MILLGLFLEHLAKSILHLAPEREKVLLKKKATKKSEQEISG